MRPALLALALLPVLTVPALGVVTCDADGTCTEWHELEDDCGGGAGFSEDDTPTYSSWPDDEVGQSFVWDGERYSRPSRDPPQRRRQRDRSPRKAVDPPKPPPRACRAGTYDVGDNLCCPVGTYLAGNKAACCQYGTVLHEGSCVRERPRATERTAAVTERSSSWQRTLSAAGAVLLFLLLFFVIPFAVYVHNRSLHRRDEIAAHTTAAKDLDRRLRDLARETDRFIADYRRHHYNRGRHD